MIQKLQKYPYLSPCTKLNSKGIRDPYRHLNMAAEKGDSLELADRGKDFLNRTALTKALRTTINKQNLMKFKSISMATATDI